MIDEQSLPALATVPRLLPRAWPCPLLFGRPPGRLPGLTTTGLPPGLATTAPGLPPGLPTTATGLFGLPEEAK